MVGRRTRVLAVLSEKTFAERREVRLGPLPRPPSCNCPHPHAPNTAPLITTRVALHLSSSSQIFSAAAAGPGVAAGLAVAPPTASTPLQPTQHNNSSTPAT